MTEVLKTSETVTVDNYPYGFRLKTTATHSLEFKRGKGFRKVFQTVNPKTGRLNAAKYSTYSPVMLLTRDSETGYVSQTGCGFNGKEEFQAGLAFMNQHFDKFTAEQIEDIYIYALAMLKVDMQATIVYCGASLEALKPLYSSAIGTLVEAVKSKGTDNKFADVKIDFAAIEACKVPNFNPFTVKHYSSAN